MTISLVIDTATDRTIVGLVDGEKVLFESFSQGATDHGRAVSDLVSRALAGNPNPEQVVVGMGQGHLLAYELVFHLRGALHLRERYPSLESVR
jgi:tRNA A37 threonylcarbamoyladenosine modification protein TsaB